MTWKSCTARRPTIWAGDRRHVPRKKATAFSPTGCAAASGEPRLAYFPFGKGPRVCIGEGFARMESVLALTSIAQRFKLTLVPGRSVVPEPKMTLRPKGGF